MLKKFAVPTLAVLMLLAMTGTVLAQTIEPEKTTWGRVKAMYRGEEQSPTPRTGFETMANVCIGWKFPFLGRRQISCFYGCGAHTGKDYYAVDWNLPGWQDYGAYVVAPAGGRVLFAGRAGDYGNSVIVDAGYGRLYRVAHLSGISVSTNMSVGQGAILGRCGNTGRASGPHIHFSVHYPASYAGYGMISGPSIPQAGISGQYNLYEWGWYDSYQWMSTP